VATRSSPCPAAVTQCQETLRTAMAIGARPRILVESSEELQPLAVASAEGAGRQEQPGLSSWASRPSTTTATRPARCWLRWPNLPQGTLPWQQGRSGRRIRQHHA